MAEESVEHLLEQWRREGPEQQIAAIDARLEQQDFAAAPAIARLLDSADPVVRFAASRALGVLGSRAPDIAGPALVKALHDSEDIVRSAAADALGVLAYAQASEEVRALLNTDPEPLVRASAAETLGDLGDVQAIADLERALRDPDEDDAVRGYAASSLGLLGTRDLLPALQTALEAGPPLVVQGEILGAQYRLGAAEALAPLLELLNTDDDTLATRILNVLTDLLDRRQPVALPAGIAQVRAAMERIARRQPLLRPHAESITARLLSAAPA